MKKFAVGAVALMLVASAALATTVDLSCPSGPISIDSFFDVTVAVAPGTPLLGLQLNLDYDGALIALTAASSPVPGQNPADVFMLGDRVWIDFNDIGPQGAGDYFTLTFQALAEPTPGPTTTIAI